MIAKQEWTQSNALQNKKKHRSPTNNWKYIKIAQHQQNHRLRLDSSLSQLGA